MLENSRFRTYKTSINILFFTYYNDSKVYEIQNGKCAIFPGLKYSLLTILFGFFGIGFPWSMYQKFKYTLNTLHINVSGGEDYTKVFTEMNFEEKTVWVFNNLKRTVFEKIDMEKLDMIIELQDEFIKSKGELFSETKLIYLIQN